MQRFCILLAALLLTPSGPTATELVLVAGASGRTGGHVLKELEKSGYAVRPLTRNSERAQRRLGHSWSWVAVDVRDANTVAESMRGIDYVVCAIGAREWSGPNSPEFVDFGGVRNLVDAARDAGVKHFVLISSAAAGPHRKRSQMEQMGEVRYWKTRGEQHLKASGLSYTIIGPGGLINEPSSGDGLRLLRRRDYTGGMVAIGDVAMLVVDALKNPDAAGKTFAAIRANDLSRSEWRSMLAELPADPEVNETATDR